MPKKSRRRQISLTVTPELWDRCREKGKKYGLNWSQIAEEAFLAVLLQLDQVENVVESVSKSVPSDLQASVVKSKLRSHINDLQTQVNQQINKELEAQIPE